MCLNVLLKELFHSFYVNSDAVPRKWMIHFAKTYKTWCTLSQFLGEHREIIVLFQENVHAKLMKVVQDFILFLLMLSNLLTVFVSSFEDLGGFELSTRFWKAGTSLFQLGILISTKWWNNAATDCPYLLSRELNNLSGYCKMHFVLIPIPSRCTNSVIGLSDTFLVVWRPSVNGSFLSAV